MNSRYFASSRRQFQRDCRRELDRVLNQRHPVEEAANLNTTPIDDQMRYSDDSETDEDIYVLPRNNPTELEDDYYVLPRNNPNELEDDYYDSNDENASDVEWSFGESSSSEEEFVETEAPTKILAELVIKFNLSRNAIHAILAFVRNELGHKDFPKTRSGLFKSKGKKIQPQKIGTSGEYFHIGIQNNLSKMSHDFLNEEKIQIDIGIDGLPLSKSSKLSLWPIVGAFVDKNVSPFVIGAFCGYKHPEDVDAFLKPLSEDIKKCNPKIEVRSFTCDAPARAMVTGVMGHNAFHGCSKCDQVGVTVLHRRKFSSTIGNLRTDESFKRREDSLHHHPNFREKHSVVEKIGIKMVSQFPPEPMHCTHLGVTKKILMLILNKKCPHFALQALGLEEMNLKFLEFNKFIPSEFVRKPRSFEEAARFKATEFRQIALYTGIVLFKSFFPQEMYEHFLHFSLALRLLTAKDIAIENADVAQHFLQYFVNRFCYHYGEDS